VANKHYLNRRVNRRVAEEEEIDGTFVARRFFLRGQGMSHGAIPSSAPHAQLPYHTCPPFSLSHRKPISRAPLTILDATSPRRIWHSRRLREVPARVVEEPRGWRWDCPTSCSVATPTFAEILKMLNSINKNNEDNHRLGYRKIAALSLMTLLFSAPPRTIFCYALRFQ